MTRDKIQEEALIVSLSKERVGLAISMGIGKTLIGLRNMQSLFNKGKKRFLVVAPKKTILQSWKDEAIKFNFKHLLQYITYTTYISLKKQSLDYDCIYLDECHNLLYSHEGYLGSFNNRILGLTGTPPSVQGSEKDLMVRTFCPIKFTYKVNDAVNDKILNDYSIIIHPLDLSVLNDFEVKTKKFSFKTSERSNYVYWSKRILNSDGKQKMMARILRMKAMMGFRTKIDYTKDLIDKIDGKCIIFCNTKEQAKEMSEYSYYSGNKDNKVNLEMFSKGEIDKLSCVEMLSEGVNIPELKNAIILHTYAGSSPKTQQRLARCLRLNPNDRAIIHLLMYNDSVDEQWVNSAIEVFDENKVKFM